MYKSFAERLLELAAVRWDGKEEQKMKCCRGLECLTAMIINGTALLLLGAASGRGKEILVYLLVWIVIRILTRARERRYDLQSTVLFLASMLLAVLAAKYAMIYGGSLGQKAYWSIVAGGAALNQGVAALIRKRQNLEKTDESR